MAPWTCVWPRRRLSGRDLEVGQPARVSRVTPVGGGSEFDPSEARTEVILHTDRLTEVEHYDPADLTVGVGAQERQ